MRRTTIAAAMIVAAVAAGVSAAHLHSSHEPQAGSGTAHNGEQAWQDAKSDISYARALVSEARSASTALTGADIDTATLDAAIEEALADLPSADELGTQTATRRGDNADAIAERATRARAIQDSIHAAAAATVSTFALRAETLNTAAVIAAALAAAEQPIFGMSSYADAEMQARLDVRRNSGLPISTIGGTDHNVSYTDTPEKSQPAETADNPNPIDMTRYVDEGSASFVPYSSCAEPKPWMKVDPGPGLTTHAGRDFAFPWSYRVEGAGQGFVHFYVCG